jgi:hypothetical protein
MKKGDLIKAKAGSNVDVLPGLGIVIDVSLDCSLATIRPEGSMEEYVVFTDILELYKTPETETKVTTANVRVMISHNYSNFEVAMQLENVNGINPTEIELARMDCQRLATDAVDQYKNANAATPAQEIERLENKIADIKATIGKHKEVTDPIEVAKIENLPLYDGKRTEAKEKK